MPTFWQQKVGRLAGRDPPCENNAGMRPTQDRKPNQPPTQAHQSQTAIKTEIAFSPATEAGSRPGRRVTFLARTRNVTQRMRPDCPRPCASLRANLRHAIQSAVRQNSLCAARAAQTRCRKSEHEALALCGANARSPNSVPQARPHGWMRVRTACMICDETGF